MSRFKEAAKRAKKNIAAKRKGSGLVHAAKKAVCDPSKRMS